MPFFTVARLNGSAGMKLFDWFTTGYHLLYVLIGIVALFVVIVLIGASLSESEDTKKLRLEREKKANEKEVLKRKEEDLHSEWDEVREQARKKSLEKIIPLEQPSAIIIRRQARHTNRNFADGENWLGGLPALEGQDWPRDSDGKPLHMMAQIDCAGLAMLRLGIGLPEKGSLVFFADVSTWIGKVIYVETPAGGLETPAPADLPLIYGDHDWSSYIKGFDRESAPRQFVRWPIDLLPLDFPGSIHEDELSEIVANFDGANRQHSASSYTLGNHLPNGNNPWLWHSAHRFSASLRGALEALLQKISRIQNAQEKTLASYAKITNNQKYSDQQKKEMTESNDRVMARYQEQLDQIHSQKEEFSIFVQQVTGWAEGHDDWASLQEPDLEYFKEQFAVVGSFGVYKELYRYSGGYSSLDRITDDTLRAMISGPQDVYERLPAQVQIETDSGCLFADLENWHQIFGFGIQVHSATEENYDKYMLLQLYSDDLMNWIWGDVGVMKFWISPNDLKQRNWEAAFLTVES